MYRKDVDDRIFELASRQASVISLPQVLDCGGNQPLAERRVNAGRWERLTRGVFRVRGAPTTWQTSLWAAHFEAGPGSAVSHQSAARVHGLRAYRKVDSIEVMKREGRAHDTVLGRLHQTSWLPPSHIVDFDGLPVTSLPRTLFDLAGDPPPHLRRAEQGLEIHAAKLRKVVNDAISHHGLRLERLAAVLADLGKRGRPGTALIRTLLSSFGPGYVATESELEDLFISVLEAYGVELPERQRRLGSDSKMIGRVDFIYRLARLIIEVDGRWHDAPLQRDADNFRDIELQAEGYRVFRVTWRQLVEHPERVVAIILKLLEKAAA